MRRAGGRRPARAERGIVLAEYMVALAIGIVVTTVVLTVVGRVG